MTRRACSFADCRNLSLLSRIRPSSRRSTPQYSEGSVEVYAPVSWSDRTQRSKLLKSLRQPIRDAIESIAGEALQGGS